jgi:hypothetical protein
MSSDTINIKANGHCRSPEIVRAPLVVKVPVTLGNVEKSYTPVMVTGTGVGGEAEAEGSEPIVKQATIHSAIAAIKSLFCRIISILSFNGELM